MDRRVENKVEGKWKWIDILILIFINFMNYTDRYSLSGLLMDMQKEFEIKNDKGGLIQTVFTLVYMSVAPLWGILGDRYNRKFLLAFAVLAWNAANLAASFVKYFWSFLVCRALLGIGQACYTTVAPTVLSDLVVGDLRSKLLAVFYIAIPVGNGAGVVVGTQMAEAFGSWRWGLRATPILCIVYLCLLLFVFKEPRRGQVEEVPPQKRTSWIVDFKYLLKNKSFMFSTLGFTVVAFTAGAVSWWAPKLMVLGFRLHDPDVDKYYVGTIFGIVCALSGLFGVCLGYLSTFKFKEKFPPVDPLVCGIGLVLSGPLLILATYISLFDQIWTYVILFFASLFLNLNWAITMDVCLYVVVPSRRSSAVGMQLLVGHGFGDAGSPYLTGLISDILLVHFDKSSDDKSNEFRALQYSYFIACCVIIVGSSFYFLNAVYLVGDIAKMKKDTEEASET